MWGVATVRGYSREDVAGRKRSGAWQGQRRGASGGPGSSVFARPDGGRGEIGAARGEIGAGRGEIGAGRGGAGLSGAPRLGLAVPLRLQVPSLAPQ